MLKLYFFAVTYVFISSSLHAQQRTLFGYLEDSITHFAILNAAVINGTSNKTVKTNEKGFFRLDVKPNDYIYATAPFYHHDMIVYSILFSDTVHLYLSPSGNVLPDVTVRTKYTKYQLDSMRRKAEFEQNRGQRLSTVSSANNLGFGIGLNLDRVFKRKDRYKRDYEKRYAKTEKMAYTDYRFSPYVVAYYTGFKGDTLRDFIYRYLPDYDWLRKNTTNEAMLYYINDKLKLYRASISSGNKQPVGSIRRN